MFQSHLPFHTPERRLRTMILTPFQMSSLLFASNRSLRYSAHLVYRTLWATAIHQHQSAASITSPQRSQLSISATPRTDLLVVQTPMSTQQRSITIQGPSVTDEDKQSSNANDRAPFRFPPGKPSDKPRLEHLRFIEEQLKRIVSASIALSLIDDQSLFLFVDSYPIFASQCIRTLCTPLI